ncbi:MAG: hypothetical protein JW783_13330 [Bacteroidales bacterium]|nr:hypothetical protein [Bacteroidales bacterium]
MRKIVNVTNLLLLLLVGICLSCEKIDSFQEQSFAHSKSNSKLERSIMMREVNYYVSKWSNLDPSALGLKELLAKIILDQQNGVVEKSVIHLIADINSGDASGIRVPAHTTITGGGGAYGENGKAIYTSIPRYKWLFIVVGENVTFERLRLIGPWSSYIANPLYSQSSGVFFDKRANRGVVQFCEVSGFPGVAISFSSVDNIVYGNNIHGNYMIYTKNTVSETIGYGVLVKDGGQAVIHNNYFDNNQHAIAGGGKNTLGVESSFEAYLNNVKDSKCQMRSHHFDMHGNDLDAFAGNEIKIYNNVFYYTARSNGWWPSAIIIRGIPQNYCKVYNNAFVNDKNINSAVRQIFEFSNNNIPFRPLNMYVWDNVCDGYPGDYYTSIVWTPGI